jgi:hypothetical protein
VEGFAVLEQVTLRIGSRLVLHAMHPLVFQAVEEAFGGRVVPAVGFAAHRGGHLVPLELPFHGDTPVWTAVVAMK